MRVGGGKKGGPQKETLDKELETYFLKNGQTEQVKQHLDRDLENFMKKQKDEAVLGNFNPELFKEQSNLTNNTSVDFAAFQQNLATTA